MMDWPVFPQQAKVRPLRELQLHSTKGMKTKGLVLFIWWGRGNIDGKQTTYNNSSKIDSVVLKRLQKILFWIHWELAVWVLVFCLLHLRHYYSNSGVPLQSLLKQNLYLCSTKSPSVFSKSGLAASLIKRRICRVCTRQNLGRIWLNRLKIQTFPVWLFFLSLEPVFWEI